MKKPYIICHIMTSVDGRIDCNMTEHLQDQSQLPLTKVSGLRTSLNSSSLLNY
ncbi:hypothetical protein [Companilactobacillus pabuli]|uniref:hypothetical protein n=1 Tax=Companilactobacillus pabuli TaxID=2714036 RepID=UPI002415F250|nr:hypothetical protein [Companilactobacillus pabuli]MDG5112116.1 hypothetical protein [Companilactobacillus pabuli]